MKNKTKFITQTAIMLALLLVLQLITKSFGQFVTGSCVNFVLAETLLTCGLLSAAVIALLSPFFAFLIGIGPAFLPIVPCISVANTVLVIILYLFLKKSAAANVKIPAAKKITAVIVAAISKFLVLYILAVKLVLPLLMLKEKQIIAITTAFSWPQLVTALIGSSLAVLLWPRLIKAKAK